MWENLEDTMLSDISQSQNNEYRDSTDRNYLEETNSQTQRIGSRFLAAGSGEGSGELLFNGYRIILW